MELHTPDFDGFCKRLQAEHVKQSDPKDTHEVPAKAFQTPGQIIVKVDMKAWGSGQG